MGNKLDFRFLVMKFCVYTNNQYTDELKKCFDSLKKKMNKHYFESANIDSLINKVPGHNKTSSPDNMDSPQAQYLTNVVPANKKATSLGGGHYTKLVACGISNMRSAHQNYMNSA